MKRHQICGRLAATGGLRAGGHCTGSLLAVELVEPKLTQAGRAEARKGTKPVTSHSPMLQNGRSPTTSQLDESRPGSRVTTSHIGSCIRSQMENMQSCICNHTVRPEMSTALAGKGAPSPTSSAGYVQRVGTAGKPSVTKLRQCAGVDGKATSACH